MRYKAGDVVKLRDDLEIDENYGGTVFTVLTHRLKHQGIKIIKVGTDYYIVEGENKITAYASDEMIEGLWEECKGITYEPYEVKTNKLKLIDILNKIANGELEEGTKVKHLNNIYIYKKYEGKEYASLYRETADSAEEDFFYDERHRFMSVILREEVELIEPYQFREDTKMIEPKECEHEWKNYTIHRIGEGIIRRYKHCKKCGLEEDIEPICEHEWEKYTLGEIGTESVELKHRRYCKICGIDEEEPTDNTTEKIEELDLNEFAQGTAIDYRIAFKLNEVIRKLNRRGNMNEISLREGLALLKEAYCEDLYELFAEEDIDKIVAEAEELKAEKDNNNE